MQKKSAEPAVPSPTLASVLAAARSTIDWCFWEHAISDKGNWWKWEDKWDKDKEKEWSDFWMIFADELEEKNIFPNVVGFLRSGKVPMKHSYTKKLWFWASYQTETEDENSASSKYSYNDMQEFFKTMKEFCVKMEHHFLTKE